MLITEDILRKLLVGPGHIAQADFELLITEAKERSQDIQAYVIEKGLMKDEELGKVIAEYINFPFINLRSQRIDDAAVSLVPEVVARAKLLIPFEINDQQIKVAMVDPTDLEIRHALEKSLGLEVIPYLTTRLAITRALSRYKKNLTDRFDRLLKKLHDPALSKEEKDTITVDMVDALISYGHENRASDIHIEPYTNEVLIRFRIDGMLHDALKIPKELLSLIITRIKIVSNMRTDEHRAAQDGKIRFKAEGETVDVRVSIVPITEGEKVVLRILSSKSRQFTLQDLGFSGDDLKKVETAAQNPHGMLLVTGPTGSGKTTSVYAILKILNVRSVNIATIEDPVEYDMEGINQIQVDEKTGLTFAKGLRAIVRQDPDIIMVGEIRDTETADIAVNSAMTGHLVLSTLHANDAATTLPRLLDMEVEPFLVASTINIIIAQRLVRRICSQCRVSVSISSEEKELLTSEPRIQEVLKKLGKEDIESLTVFKGNGCKACGDTGYSGRIGIFELLVMTEDIKKLVVNQASSEEIIKTAVAGGMSIMFEDGMRKVILGDTTLEEILRVTRQ